MNITNYPLDRDFSYPGKHDRMQTSVGKSIIETQIFQSEGKFNLTLNSKVGGKIKFIFGLIYFFSLIFFTTKLFI